MSWSAMCAAAIASSSVCKLRQRGRRVVLPVQFDDKAVVAVATTPSGVFVNRGWSPSGSHEGLACLFDRASALREIATAYNTTVWRQGHNMDCERKDEVRSAGRSGSCMQRTLEQWNQGLQVTWTSLHASLPLKDTQRRESWLGESGNVDGGYC